MNNITNKMLLEKLLCYGFFPKEISAILTSEDFGKWVILNKSSIKLNKETSFPLLKYKLTRNNNVPRYMGIPNPFAYFRLCNLLYLNWLRIQKIFGKVKDYKNISMITTKPDNKGERLVLMGNYGLNPEEEKINLDKQMGKKYLSDVDISNFFPSIYTHSICWALAGKKTAKTNKKYRDKWYNEIDQAIRNMQDKETIGLPLGPDTSFILSEVVLAQIDSRLSKYSYLRHIDDYKCYCDTKDQAEDFIKNLSSALEEYNLRVNPRKTKISTLPLPITNDWVRRLRNFNNQQNITKKNGKGVLDFLDLSVELFKTNPDASSIKYVFESLKHKNYEDYLSYELILIYILNLCFLFPYLLESCEEIISIGIHSFQRQNSGIKNILKISLNKILKEHIQHNRSDAITWCIYLAIKYDIKIDGINVIIKKIISINDCIPALMIFLYAKINNEDYLSLLELINKVDVNEWWLFIYEVKRIENKKNADANMEYMRKSKITFLVNEINSKILV